jgi:hypothetical protein
MPSGDEESEDSSDESYKPEEESSEESYDGYSTVNIYYLICYSQNACHFYLPTFKLLA